MQIRTPEGMAAGAYANGVAVWSSPSEFTIDFLVSLPAEPGVNNDTGQAVMVLPQQVVSRVKIPPPLVFQLMRNLNSTMEAHEQQHGQIPEFQSGARPQQPPEGGTTP